TTGKESEPLLRHASGFTALAFLPDGQSLAVGTNAVLNKSSRGELILYDLAGKKVKQRFGELVDVKSLTISRDGRLLAAGDGVGGLRLWDLKAGTARRLAGHDHSVHGLAFSPDGRTLASGSWDQTVKLWRVSEGDELFTLHARDQVTALAFSADGQTLA